MKTTLLFSCFLLGLFSANAQSFIEDDKERSDRITEFFYKAHPYIYTNKDSAYFYLEKALKVSDPKQDHDFRLFLLNWLSSSSSFYYDLPKYKEVLNRADTIFKIDSIQFKLADYQKQKDEFNRNKGVYYFQLADYTRAKPYFQQLANQYKSYLLDEHTEKSIGEQIRVNNYLATIYRNEGKYDIAEQYYLNTGKLINSFYQGENDGPFQKAANEQLLAELYNRTGKYQKANGLLRNSLQLYLKVVKNNPAFENIVNVISQKLSENQLKQDSVTQALNTLNESQAYLTNDDPFHRKAQLLYGDIYLKQKDFSQSKNFYNNALEAYQDYRNYLPHEDVANCFLKLGILSQKQSDFDTALKYLQKALMASTANFSNADISSNPGIQKAFSKRQLISIFRQKLEVLNATEGNHENTYSVSKAIINTLDALRAEFDSKLDKEFLIEQTYPVFNEIIDAMYKAHEATRDKKYLEFAFLAMEKSKSILLLETLKNAEATKFGRVPDSVLNKGQLYRANITVFEKKLFDAKENRSALADSLFRLNNEYRAHLEAIETGYPKYYQLKYDNSITDVKDVQSFLNNDELLINFHDADSVLYAMVLSSEKSQLLKLLFNKKIKSKVESLYRKLSVPSLENDAELKALSHSVYQHILSPLLDKTEASNLIIIPDGLLSYIPFGVLSRDASKWDYLMKDYGIRYASSATVMTRPFQNKNRKTSNKLLALAPTFGDTSLYDLPFSQTEVTQVSSHFDTEILLGPQATLNRFNELNSEYGLVHLATHASANDEFPDYSYLAFTPEGENESRLYVKDLYNQSINANMVTLSACQTGIGKLQKGEGLLSIERGFMYAGAKSLTTTMWKNNDKTTSQLMDLYYGHLKKGESKDRALQLAKQDYLATTTDDLLKHPYYWAGFKVIGDNSPVNSSSKWWYWVLGILFVLVITKLTKPTLFKLIE